MDTMQIVIEPQRICPCGKSYIPMTAEERRAYDEAIRRIEEKRRSQAGEPSAEMAEDKSSETVDRK